MFSLRLTITKKAAKEVRDKAANNHGFGALLGMNFGREESNLALLWTRGTHNILIQRVLSFPWTFDISTRLKSMF